MYKVKNTIIRSSLLPLLFVYPFTAEVSVGHENGQNFRGKRLQTVVEFADNVLSEGRDRWSGEHTPLFADGLNVRTREPVVWRYRGNEYIVSNMASQQNLFRVLVGLSRLTGEDRYREAAEASIEYHFENLVDDSGLLRWGGHQFIDLSSLEPVGDFDADCHEFKNNFPFYELMWDVDPEATARFLRALWNAHIQDWGVLDMNRHGGYGQSLPENLWDQDFGNPEPFYEGDGLTFINAGSDLIYAAGKLFSLADDEKAWTWGRRMAELYVNARHPETGLGSYQYSKPRRRHEPPEDGPLTDRLTWSMYGDRAENQFGEQFGETAREGWVIWGGRINTIYSTGGFLKLGLAENMEDNGKELIEWTADGLEALFEYAYIPEKNAFLPMWADGTDLSGKTFDRTGYYGEEGTGWKPRDADMRFLGTYARAYRLTRRPALWEAARDIARGLGLGDIGSRPGEELEVSLNAPGDSPEEVFTMLELYRAAEHDQYLRRAEIVADRMVENRFHQGFFLPDKNHVNARFDATEPLALLTLEAVRRGTPELVPTHVRGRGYIHGRFDGHGRTYDHRVIWNKLQTTDLEVDDELMRGKNRFGSPAMKDGILHFDGEEDALVFRNSPVAFEDDDRFSIVVRARMSDDNRFLCAFRYHLSRDNFRTRGDQPLRVNLDLQGDAFHTIVVTYDGDLPDGSRELKVYVDGKPAGIDTGDKTDSPLSSYHSTDLNLGRTEHSNGIYSEVEIAGNVKVHTRVLSAEEVAELAE